jgi:hypothetical protein
MSYAVAQSTREFGLPMALGADAANQSSARTGGKAA